MKFFERMALVKKKEKSDAELHSSSFSKDTLESLRKTILDTLPVLERELTEPELRIVTDANRRTSAIMEKYGVTSQEIDTNKIHVIPSNVWPGGDAFFDRESNAIVLPESDNSELFKLRLVHEMFHLKGVNFLPIPLTEAIVERLTNEAINSDDSSLSAGEKLSGVYTYIDYMRMFDSFLEKIVQSAPAGVTNVLHTYSFFAKAHLSGDIEYLSFLNDLFGPDTLEKLYSLDDNPTSFEKFIENLQATL